MKALLYALLLLTSTKLLASEIFENQRGLGFQTVQALTDISPRAAVINLLGWKDTFSNPPPPPEDYNRTKHFGSWLSIKDDRSCLDVRNRVLARDSMGKVALRPEDPCRIKSGSWHDDYINHEFTNPTDMDIDHMVPLKNAYINGAWKWNNDVRCLYANYMGNDFHLKAVGSRQNIIKSDQAPNTWMPPNKAYYCEYLKNWLTIKLIWRLGLQRSEAEAIRTLIVRSGCDSREFVYSADELSRQRQKIQSLVRICAARNSPPATP